MFYHFAIFGLAASSVLWACGAVFCLIAASAGSRCCPARLRDGGGLRGAHGSQEERRRQNEPRRRGTVEAGYNIYICFAQTHSGFLCLVLHILYVRRFVIVMHLSRMSFSGFVQESHFCFIYDCQQDF